MATFSFNEQWHVLFVLYFFCMRYSFTDVFQFCKLVGDEICAVLLVIFVKVINSLMLMGCLMLNTMFNLYQVTVANCRTAVYSVFDLNN